MSDEVKVDGACYCGEVTVSGIVFSDKVLACHCRDCQKFSGAPFRAVAVMSSDQVAISGVVKEYLKIADSGNERIQGFCGNCGSQIYAADPERHYLWSALVVYLSITSLCLRSIFLVNLRHHG